MRVVWRGTATRARRGTTWAVCLVLIMNVVAIGISGCAKRGAQGTSSSPLVGNWETATLATGGKKVFYLSEGGTGVVDEIGDRLLPEGIVSWSFDGFNLTYTSQTISGSDNTPPVTRTFRCALSPDGNSFRLLLGDKGFDSDPIAQQITTYHRVAITASPFPWESK